MEAYYVEGIFITRKGLKKAQKSVQAAPADLEPFAQRIYANSPQEALQIAEAALQGGRWWEKPRVSKITEEQRMRQAGAPELPGFDTAPARQTPKKPKHSG